jgi:uncharacterized OB-fold protein
MSTVDSQATRPVPAPTELTRPHWDAANQDRLAIQRCQQCRHYHQPPVSFCTECNSEDLNFDPVSGQGTIYSYTVTHDARTPAFSAIQPYAVVWVELDEQPGLMIATNMFETPLDAIRIGARVEVYFEQLGLNYKLPQFRYPAAQTSPAADER